MKWKSRPTLVTMEGDTLYDTDALAEYLGIDYTDAELIGAGALTAADIDYLNRKYPEYMGAWPLLLAKVAGAVGSGIKAIVNKAKKKKKKSTSTAATDEKYKQLLSQMQTNQQVQTAKSDQTKKLLMIGIPAGIGLLLLVTMMNRRNN